MSELVEKARWQGSQAEVGANSHLITELAGALAQAEATITALSADCKALEADREYNAGLAREAQAQCAAMREIIEQVRTKLAVNEQYVDESTAPHPIAELLAELELPSGEKWDALRNSLERLREQVKDG